MSTKKTKLVELTLESVEDTKKLAECISQILQPNDVILLDGGLGAGKSEFVRHMARYLGVSEDVRSPTYDLIRMYPLSNGALVHCDAYRLESDIDFLHLDIESIAEESILAIEWGLKYQHLYQDYLCISLAAHSQRSDSRLMNLFSKGPNWTGRNEKLTENIKQAFCTH